MVPLDEPDTELMWPLTLVAVEPDVCDARVRVAAHEKGAGQVGPGIEGVVRGNRQHVERGVRPHEHDILTGAVTASTITGLIGAVCRSP